VAIPVTSTALSGTAGTVAAPAAVGASETISRVHVGKILEVFNGGVGSINVTIVDPGKTPAGNTATSTAYPVAAGARRRWKLTRQYVGTNKLITIEFSGTTSVTAEVLG
jgi:hypothetical protein